MKNLKIRTKITLGFAAVIILLIVSTLSATISSTTAIQNLRYINSGSDLQTLGNNLMDTFNSARLNVKTITLELNDEAYGEAVKSLESCNGIIDEMYNHISLNSNLERFREELNSVREYIAVYRNNADTIQKSNAALEELELKIEELGITLNTLSNSLNDTLILNNTWNIRHNAETMTKYGLSYTNYDEDLQFIDDTIALVNRYNGESDHITELVMCLRDFRASIAAFSDEMLYNSNMVERSYADGQTMVTSLTTLIRSIETAMGNRITNTIGTANTYLAAILSIAVISVIISIIISALIVKSITKPVNRLKSIMNDVASGNLDVSAESNSSDEIGELTQAAHKVIETVLLLIREEEMLSKSFEAGDIDARIDSSLFEGSYKTMAEGINGTVAGLIKDSLMLMDYMKECGDGNFNASIPKLPGKKAIMNENYDRLCNNLKAISNEINSLVENAIKGMLSSRAGADKYKGGWAEILTGLNRLMETIAAPINEAERVLAYVSNGDFNHKVTGSYQGDFLLIKNSINATVTNVASYINEISGVLGALTMDDLDQAITREYVGKFSEIKQALNNIIDKLNSIISDISSASNQVAAGAKQISESSMSLAQGASEQASSVEQLNATITTINDKMIRNAHSAKEAVGLSANSKDNAQLGNHEMKDMLESMDKINESSQNISKIIKVIDDIAFQTNLLALNAAVEAARAGSSGKGFGVVADEVRSLAVKSKEASGEISEYIEESIERVGTGTNTAGTTANALDKIVDDVTSVSDIIDHIAEASQQQAEAIGQVTEGISQITEVVQSNSAISQEAAAAAQQLSSQAEMLQSLVSVFKLKKNFQ